MPPASTSTAAARASGQQRAASPGHPGSSPARPLACMAAGTRPAADGFVFAGPRPWETAGSVSAPSSCPPSHGACARRLASASARTHPRRTWMDRHLRRGHRAAPIAGFGLSIPPAHPSDRRGRRSRGVAVSAALATTQAVALVTHGADAVVQGARRCTPPRSRQAQAEALTGRRPAADRSRAPGRGGRTTAGNGGHEDHRRLGEYMRKRGKVDALRSPRAIGHPARAVL